MAQTGGGQDTLAVPVKQHHQGDQVGLNEDLVRILKENLLQQEKPRCPQGKKSPSPRLRCLHVCLRLPCRRATLHAC
ncbi:hypothetical protein Baya_6897 [Bagarius yarrelli]|uniref:Uncharacterized protein n=1 Tax=Bagarius yarrelli TaxID=175774 RepID=A0A556U381_BAGYA|nr:hypothetical protein Baya_6897 [Bagarius yarrelli]